MIEKFELLPQPDTFNANKRYYSKEVLEKALEKYNEVISEDKALVMIGAPSEENQFSVDLTQAVGRIIKIEFNDTKYIATIKFNRPTKEVSNILEGKHTMVVGLNQVAAINENFEVSDLKIISASIISDPRLQIDPIEDLRYFVDRFKSRPFDHRYRNQLVTIIDTIYSNEKIKRELENVKEKDWTQENT